MPPNPNHVAAISSASFAPPIPREVIKGKLFVGPTSFVESFVSREVARPAVGKVRKVLCVCCTPDLAKSEVERIRKEVTKGSSSKNVVPYFCPLPTSLACATNMVDLVEKLQASYRRALANGLKKDTEKDGAAATGDRRKGTSGMEWGQNSLLSPIIRSTLNAVNDALFPTGVSGEEEEGGKEASQSVVFFHCLNGKRESAALIMLYLMIYRQFEFSDALSLVPGTLIDPPLLMDLADVSASRAALQQTCQTSEKTTSVPQETSEVQGKRSDEGAGLRSREVSVGSSLSSLQSNLGSQPYEAFVYVLQWMQLRFPMIQPLTVELALIRAKLPDTQQESLRSLLAEFETHMREDEFTILGDVFIRTSKQTLSSMSVNELCAMSAMRELTRTARLGSTTDDAMRACAERLCLGVDEKWYTCLEYFRLQQVEVSTPQLARVSGAEKFKSSPSGSSIVSPRQSGAGGASYSESGMDQAIFSLPNSLSPTPRQHVGTSPLISAQVAPYMRDGELRTAFHKSLQMSSKDSPDAIANMTRAEQPNNGGQPAVSTRTNGTGTSSPLLISSSEQLTLRSPERTMIPPLALKILSPTTLNEESDGNAAVLSVSFASTSSLPVVHIPPKGKVLAGGPLRYGSFDRAMQTIRQKKDSNSPDIQAASPIAATTATPKSVVAVSDKLESSGAQTAVSDSEMNSSFALGSSQRRVRFDLPPSCKSAGENKQPTPRSTVYMGGMIGSPRIHAPKASIVDTTETPAKQDCGGNHNRMEAPEKPVNAKEKPVKAPENPVKAPEEPVKMEEKKQGAITPTAPKPAEPKKVEKPVIQEANSPANVTAIQAAKLSLSDMEIRKKVQLRTAQREEDVRLAHEREERRRLRMASAARFLGNPAGPGETEAKAARIPASLKKEGPTSPPCNNAHVQSEYPPNAHHSTTTASKPLMSSDIVNLSENPEPQPSGPSLSPSPARTPTTREQSIKEVPPLSATSLTSSGAAYKSTSSASSRSCEKAIVAPNNYSIANASFHAIQRAADEISSSRAGSPAVQRDNRCDSFQFSELSPNVGHWFPLTTGDDVPARYNSGDDNDESVDKLSLYGRETDSNNFEAVQSYSPRRAPKRHMGDTAQLGNASILNSTAQMGATNSSILWYPHSNINQSFSNASVSGGRYAKYCSVNLGESFTSSGWASNVNDVLGGSGLLEEENDDDDEENASLSGTFSSLYKRQRLPSSLNQPPFPATLGTASDYFRDMKAAENIATGAAERRGDSSNNSQAKSSTEKTAQSHSDDGGSLSHAVSSTKSSIQHPSSNPALSERAENAITSLYKTVGSPYVSREEIAAEYINQGGKDAAVLVTMMQLHRERAGVQSATRTSTGHSENEGTHSFTRMSTERGDGYSTSSDGHHPPARLDLNARPMKSALKNSSRLHAVGAPPTRSAARPLAHPPARPLGLLGTHPPSSTTLNRANSKSDGNQFSPQETTLPGASSSGPMTKRTSSTQLQLQQRSLPGRPTGLSASVTQLRPSEGSASKRNSLLSTMPPAPESRKLFKHSISKTSATASAPSSVTRRTSNAKSTAPDAGLASALPPQPVRKSTVSGTMSPRGNGATPKRRVSGALTPRNSVVSSALVPSASKTSKSSSTPSETPLKPASAPTSMVKRASVSGTGSKTKRALV